MSHLIEKKDIDPYYVQYITDTDDVELIDQVIEDTVLRFRSEGYKTVVITDQYEVDTSLFLIRCAAVNVTYKGKQKILSTKAESIMTDQLGLNEKIREASIEPKMVSFNLNKKRKF